MAIPKEILDVVRPKNTRVKKNGNHYDVIKRTCVYKNGRNVPKELGKIGEIINGVYVATNNKKLHQGSDIKDAGKILLANKVAQDILPELCEYYDTPSAKKIYCLALLRAAYGNVCIRDLQYRYETSFLSELIPGIALSENSVSDFLELVGSNINTSILFMKSKLDNLEKGSVAIVDGMLKDCNCETSDFVQWSRKSRLKGTKEISLLYAFDSKTGEPLAHKIYPGNMLDNTAFDDFLNTFKPQNSLIMGDKGFVSKETLNNLSSKKIDYLFPIKRNDKRIGALNLYDYQGTFNDDDDIIEYCKNFTKGIDDNDKTLYFYSYKSMLDETNEKSGYLKNADKKGSYNIESKKKKQDKFGTIVFISNKDMNPKDVYFLYEKRWEIETYFSFYKNFASLNNVRVQGDISIIGSEFINFISSIVSVRIKKLFKEKELNKKYTYPEIMMYLESVKKYRDIESGNWVMTKTLKYVAEIVTKLEI